MASQVSTGYPIDMVGHYDMIRDVDVDNTNISFYSIRPSFYPIYPSILLSYLLTSDPPADANERSTITYGASPTYVEFRCGTSYGIKESLLNRFNIVNHGDQETKVK